MPDKIIKIKNKSIGPGCPVFIIAEAGVNHNGSLELAKKLVDVAVAAGVDAIKFQTFTPELLVIAEADQAEYQRRNTGKSEPQISMLKNLELKREYHPMLQDYCYAKNIIFLSTPFSESDADFLESINVPAYKIPSGEITNIPYLRHIARFKKPMLVSSGMATLEELKEAVAAVRAEDNDEIIILHSTSNYPPSLSSLNLNAISTISQAFKDLNIAVGYSDNGSAGVLADVAAVALGACVIEKHFTIDKNLPGPDHRASLDPEELKSLVLSIRDTEKMLGSGIKVPSPEELPIAAVARKSIISSRAIKAGQVIAAHDLIMKRPGTGIKPGNIDLVIGKKAKIDIAPDAIITWEMLS